MKTYEYLKHTISLFGAAYLVLIDPDKISGEKLVELVRICERDGVDAFLIGGSLMVNGDLTKQLELIKANSSLPAIIFPGAVNQVSHKADALLFISLVSGRNPEQLIGKQVIAAPLIKRSGLETISTGYMLVESGNTTAAQYMSGSLPIPRNKPEIAVATALAAQYLGMKMIYLEAGSGALNSVPNEMISAVANSIDIPLIVGGGLRSAAEAYEKVKGGANIIVTGNYFEDPDNWGKIKDFAEAIHYKNIKSEQ